MHKEKTGIKPKTFDSYESNIENCIITYKDFDLANKQLGSINKKLMQKFFKSLSKKYSRSTIKKTFTIINQCLDYAVEEEDVEFNFMNKITLPTEDEVAVKKKEIQFLQEEDMKLLYQESKRIILLLMINEVGKLAHLSMVLMHMPLYLLCTQVFVWENF